MSKPMNPAERFFVRYNLVILVVVAAAILSVTVFLSYQSYITATTPTAADIKSEIPTNFDQQTTEKIESLHASDEEGIVVTEPQGRYDPFTE